MLRQCAAAASGAAALLPLPLSPVRYPPPLQLPPLVRPPPAGGVGADLGFERSRVAFRDLALRQRLAALVQRLERHLVPAARHPTHPRVQHLRPQRSDEQLGAHVERGVLPEERGPVFLATGGRRLVGDDAEHRAIAIARQHAQHRLRRDQLRTEALAHAAKPGVHAWVADRLVEPVHPRTDLERNALQGPFEVVLMRGGKHRRAAGRSAGDQCRIRDHDTCAHRVGTEPLRVEQFRQQFALPSRELALHLSNSFPRPLRERALQVAANHRTAQAEQAVDEPGRQAHHRVQHAQSDWIPQLVHGAGLGRFQRL